MLVKRNDIRLKNLLTHGWHKRPLNVIKLRKMLVPAEQLIVKPYKKRAGNVPSERLV